MPNWIAASEYSRQHVAMLQAARGCARSVAGPVSNRRAAPRRGRAGIAEPESEVQDGCWIIKSPVAFQRMTSPPSGHEIVARLVQLRKLGGSNSTLTSRAQLPAIFASHVPSPPVLPAWCFLRPWAPALLSTPTGGQHFVAYTRLEHRCLGPPMHELQRWPEECNVPARHRARKRPKREQKRDTHLPCFLAPKPPSPRPRPQAP